MICVKPIHTFERAGSKVSFDTKTFTCVYVNFSSIGITIKPILGENYTLYAILLAEEAYHNKVKHVCHTYYVANIWC